MSLLEYLGRFHPLAVHLPIGILSIFLVLGVLVKRKQLIEAYHIVRLILLVSALCATLSSVTGYMLVRSGSYNSELATTHQYLGITLTFINWAIYFWLKWILNVDIRLFIAIWFIVLSVMLLTGHMGGSLTHGSDFLTLPVREWISGRTQEDKQIVLSSRAYEVAALTFRDKCYACHGKNKQKGGLRLDSESALRKGGRNGGLISENTSSSLLIERLLLPLEDDEHMPPKEKEQLTSLEMDYIFWWLEKGAPFEQTLGELNLPDSLNDVLTKEETGGSTNYIPRHEVNEADEKTIQKLQSLDVIVMPVGSNSNYLTVNLVNVLPQNLSGALAELSKLEPQLIWLYMDYQQPGVEDWEIIGSLSALRRLSVKNSNISDTSLIYFQPLTNLMYLNLVGTDITLSGLKQLKELQNIETLYLYQTETDRSHFQQIEEIFPGSSIDIGNYKVPVLKSDTTVLRMEDLKSR